MVYLCVFLANCCPKKLEKICWSYIDTLVSGTPIIQDGMLVGAVTHVFVNNTKQGYAIFAERMLETSVCQDMKKYEQILQNAA